METFLAQSDPATSTSEVLHRFPDVVSSLPGDLGHFVPEIILCIGVCWLILFDLFSPLTNTRRTGYHAFAFVAAALMALLCDGISIGTPRPLFTGLIVHDGFAHFLKLLMFSGTLICIPMVMMHRGFDGRRMGEFYSLLLGALVGMCLMVSSKNLLMFYIGIEFASITCYLMTAYIKEDRLASEGGLKYVIYGSVASGMMLYGLSLFYGLTGSLDIAAIAGELQVGRTMNMTLIVASLLVLAGFAYKIAAYPMHFWCPDVYEGAPVPFTAFLSVISKAAGFAVLIRFVWAFSHGGDWTLTLASGAIIPFDWPLVLGIVAALTMTLGNLAALFQKNMKRLLAYSSIAHAGYLLMGVAAIYPVSGDSFGWESVLFYLTVYVFMNLGAFMVVAILSNQTGDETVDGFRGLGRRHPVLAIAMLFFLISLIGLPPTGGLTGKLQLLMAAINNNMFWLAVCAGLNTAISVFYYARIIKAMFLADDESRPVLQVHRVWTAFVVAMVIPVLYFGVAMNSAVEFIRHLSFEIGG